MFAIFSNRFARTVLLCSLLFLSACSSTTFVYNRLDFFIPWYLDDYVELDRAQEEQLDALLLPFLGWHRQEELPRYVALLDRIGGELDRPLSPAQIAAIYSDLEGAWLRLQERALEWLLVLGARLSDEQVEEFLEHLWERQQDFEDEYLDRSDREYREESYEALRDSMQDYLGRLSSEQRDRLQAASMELQRSDAIWLQERAVWLERLGILLQRQPGWELRTREAIALRDETVSAQYLATYEHNLGVIFSAVADVLNARSAEQDRRLRGELRDLREDLEGLIAQGGD